VEIVSWVRLERAPDGVWRGDASPGVIY